MRDPKSSFVLSARGHRQAPRWLRALCLCGALLAGGTAAQAGAPGTLVVLGSHVDAGSASFEKDVKAAARTALERKDDQWHLSFVAYLKKPPGAEEDRTGLPFVGAAGDLLTRMIAAMGLTRAQVYIANVVKCRPPGNRTPEPDEVAACGPFLRAQLQALAPRVIIALGRTPAQFLMGNTAPITRIRGTWHRFEGIPLMPTFHPAYLLRTPSAKRDVWEDLKQVMAKLKEPPAGGP